jgi:hypothetical protein
MHAAVLFLCISLANALDFAAAGASGQDTPRGVVDVIVFYADPPRDVQRYAPEVQRELQRFVERVRAYRPRSRPAGLGSVMRMVYAAREGYEAKLVAAATAEGTDHAAQAYVDALRPCYEWEGFHDCPEREALFAEQYLLDHPQSPFRDFLRLLAAHRWLCTAEAYDYEQKPAQASHARRAYENALRIAAVDSRSPLMTTAAGELKARGRCHLTDPFRGRRD